MGLSLSRRCSHCGKTFYYLYLGNWRYRLGNDYYCSWKCFREEEKVRKKKKLIWKGEKDES